MGERFHQCLYDGTGTAANRRLSVAVTRPVRALTTVFLVRFLAGFGGATMKQLLWETPVLG